MLGYTMRSRLVGLTNKPFFHSRVFSTAPVLRERINLEQAFAGKLDLDWTPEIVTLMGMARVMDYSSFSTCDNAESIARAKASLVEENAYDCNLHFTSEILDSLPRLPYDVWKLQMGAAHAIIERHQRFALLRAGILAPWLVCKHTSMEAPLEVGLAFRLPKEENPQVFEESLRDAGLVGGKFEVSWGAQTEFWGHCIEALGRSV